MSKTNPLETKLRRTYKFVSISQLMVDNVLGKDGLPIVEERLVIPACKLDIVPVSFGDVAHPDFACVQYPEGWNPGTIHLSDVKIYKIRNAIVHGERGFITVDDMFLSDSLKLPGFKHSRLQWVGHNLISLPEDKPLISAGDAAHIFCGYPGNRNYAHFIIDILSAALVPPLSYEYDKKTILLPKILSKYQAEYFSYFPELFNRAVFLDDSVQVHCYELSISSFSINAEHNGPNPYHLEVMKLIKGRILAATPPSVDLPKKIYISRKDSNARRLVNEDEVITILEKNGFTSVSLTGMDVTQQVQLFSNATHIVAPHGAGLTNNLFCTPGTVFCELMLNTYVKWSMRFISSLVPVVYGCVIGQEVGIEQDISRRQWRIDPVKLEFAMLTMPTK